MFRGLTNSVNLFKATWSVLQADKELLVFPVVSSVAAIIVLATFGIPTVLTIGSNDGAVQAVGIVFLFLTYFALDFVIIFANTALVGAALIRLRGGDPTLGDGVRIALSRLGSIIVYALISATIGLILRVLESVFRSSGKDRGLGGLLFSIVGQIIVALIGAAWSIATYLVIPIFVIENIGPLDAIKRSTQLLKKTWGEQIAGNIGLGWVTFLAALVIFLVAGAGIFLATSLNSIELTVFVGIVFALAMLALILIASTLGSIYSAAVYRYAAEGAISPQFAPELVQNTFRGTRPANQMA